MEMNIIYATDDLYSKLVLVSLKSLFMNNQDTKEINVYIIEDHVTEENKKRLIELAEEYRRNIEFVPLSEKYAALYSSVSGQKRVSPVVYSYCFLQDILPETVNKALLLEGDAIVLGSIGELYETDLTDYYFAAADDLQSKWIKKKLGMRPDSPYVNSGVILFNFKEMRRNGVTDKITEIINRDDSEFFYEAQDELNILAEGKVKVLPPKYNSTTAIFLFNRYKDMLRYRMPSTPCTEQEFQEAREHPVIIHFTKNQVIQPRPWIEGCVHPYEQYYLDVKKKTVLANEKLWPAKIKKMGKMFGYFHSKGAQSFIAIILGPIHSFFFPMFLYKFL